MSKLPKYLTQAAEAYRKVKDAPTVWGWYMAAKRLAMATLETVAPPGRHLALVKTKLEEACMFAVRAVAVDPANQAAVQLGTECTEAALIGEYERRIRDGQKAIDAAGINHTL